MNDLTATISEFGLKPRKGFSVSGCWNTTYMDFIKNNKEIKCLVFLYARGWIGSDYSFLKELNGIEELVLDVGNKAQGLSSIEMIESLEDLTLGGIIKSDIQLPKLKNLRSCSLTPLTKPLMSIFNCVDLENLFLNETKLKDWSGLANLSKLKYLSLNNSNIDDLSFLNNMPLLEELELNNCKKIERFEQIGTLKNLKKLIINGCSKISSIQFLSQSLKLTELNLGYNKAIESLLPLSKLQKLEGVVLLNTNVIDGNLTLLTEMQNLKRIFLNNKRHYNYKLIKKQWSNPQVKEVLLESKS